jgi:hypothetical protein
MLMLFKDDANILNLKQALYNLLKKDKDAIDRILNLIYADKFIKKVPLE